MQTLDMSETGCKLFIEGLKEDVVLTRVRLFGRHGLQVDVEVEQVRQIKEEGRSVFGAFFVNLNPMLEYALVQILFSPADSWINFEAPLDSLGQGFMDVLRTPARVSLAMLRQMRSNRKQAAPMRARTTQSGGPVSP